MLNSVPTFRVFLSSTFVDMQEERRALMKEWKYLDQFCKERGARFQAVDLRWGISAEDSDSQQALTICLREIERCQRVTPRPNFVVLLGDRYGWRPVPSVLSHESYTLASTRDSRGLLAKWYERDDNVWDPSGKCQTTQFVLKPRAEGWEDDEAALAGVLESIGSGFQTEPAAISAVEHEVLRGILNVAGIEGHAFCHVRTITNFDGDELSVRRTAATKTDVRPQGGIIKRARDLGDFHPVSGVLDELAHDRVRGLAKRIEAAGVTTNEHKTWWTTAGKLDSDYLGALCKAIREQLQGVIEEELRLRATVEPREVEDGAHREREDELAPDLFRRDDELRRAYEVLTDARGVPLLISGERGVGKSGFMARLARDLRRGAVGSTTVITRFVGLTAESTEGSGLLSGIWAELEHAHGTQRPCPIEPAVLVGELRKRLRSMSTSGPVAILIDGLDQLEDGDIARHLDWIPAELSSSVALAVSCRSWPANFLANNTAESLTLSGFDDRDAWMVLDTLLQRSGRTLSDEQQHAVTGSLRGRVVEGLHLRLLFEEVRTWRSTAPVGDMSETSRDAMIRFLDHMGSGHGHRIFSSVVTLLAGARSGLLEAEIYELLSGDKLVLDEYSRNHLASPRPPDGKLPFMVWSRLFGDLEPYLMMRGAPGGAVLSYRFQQFLDIVQERIDAGHPCYESRHRDLARFFGDALLDISLVFSVVKQIDMATQRSLHELPHQLALGGECVKLVSTLGDLRFVNLKLAAKQGRGLLSDYALALRVVTDPVQREILLQWLGFLRSEFHLLVRYPELTFQQAMNSSPGGAPALAAAQLAQEGSVTGPWIRLVGKGAGFTPDEFEIRFTVDARGAVIAKEARMAVRVSAQGKVEVTDLISGAPRQVFDMTLTGVREVATSPAGNLLTMSTSRGRGVVAKLDGSVLYEFSGCSTAGGPVVGCSDTAGFWLDRDGRLKTQGSQTFEGVPAVDRILDVAATGQRLLLRRKSHRRPAIVWDVGVAEPRMLADDVVCGALSTSGDFAVVCTRGNNVHMVDLRTQFSHCASLKHVSGSIRIGSPVSCDVSVRANLVAALATKVGAGVILCMWRANDGAFISMQEVRPDARTVDILSDGRIAIGVRDGVVFTRCGHQRTPGTTVCHSDRVEQIVRADSGLVASRGRGDFTVLFSDPETGHTIRSDTDRVAITVLSFAETGVIIGNARGEIRLSSGGHQDWRIPSDGALVAACALSDDVVLLGTHDTDYASKGFITFYWHMVRSGETFSTLRISGDLPVSVAALTAERAACCYRSGAQSVLGTLSVGSDLREIKRVGMVNALAVDRRRGRLLLAVADRGLCLDESGSIVYEVSGGCQACGVDEKSGWSAWMQDGGCTVRVLDADGGVASLLELRNPGQSLFYGSDNLVLGHKDGTLTFFEVHEPTRRKT